MRREVLEPRWSPNHPVYMIRRILTVAMLLGISSWIGFWFVRMLPDEKTITTTCTCNEESVTAALSGHDSTPVEVCASACCLQLLSAPRSPSPPPICYVSFDGTRGEEVPCDDPRMPKLP